MTDITLPKLNQTGTNEWADVEDNDKAIRDVVNGNLDNGNIKSTAAIAYSKLGVIPACRLTTTSFAVSNDTYTLLTFGTETYDTASLHSTSANTERIVANAAGIWSFTATVSFPSATYATLEVEIVDGGGTTLAEEWRTASGVTKINVAAQTKMAANDYAFVRLYQVSGASRTVASASFTGTYLGASS